MKQLLFLFPLFFLIACGGGSGSGASISGSDISSLYSGKKTQATLDQSNYVAFVRVLFGDNDVPNALLARNGNSARSVSSDFHGFMVNSILVDSMLSHASFSPRVFRRTISETRLCEGGFGTVHVSGAVNDSALTGELVSEYDSCTIDGVTLNGSSTLDIHKYNQTFDQIEHYTLSYNDLEIVENNQQYTSSVKSVVKFDFIRGILTTIDNILNDRGGKETLFENFTTEITHLGEIKLAGKIYHQDHGYVVVSTEQSVQYSSDTYYPITGGPILMQGSSQTLKLLPQENGTAIQLEYLDESGEVVHTLIGDTSEFTIKLLIYNEFADQTDVSFQLQLSEPLKEEGISFSDLQLMSANGDVIPSDVTYNSGQNTIILTPRQSLEYLTSYQFELAGTWHSIYGKDLQFDSPITFTTNADSYGPKIISVLPASNSINIQINSKFVVEFNEAINANSITSDDRFLRFTGSNGLYSWVATNAQVSGNKLTITPLETLAYGEKYFLSLEIANNSEFQDIRGNGSHFIDTWSFETLEYDKKIDLGVGISYFDLDKSTNKLYALDNINNELLIINLTTDEVENRHHLSQVPSRFCIDSGNDRIYITTMNALIEEYRVSDFQKMASISWSAKSSGYDDAHFAIRCGDNKLFVADADWSPRLFSIDRSAPYTETLLSGIESVGDFQIASSGAIYTWFQYGWNAGLAGSRVQHFQEESEGLWRLSDETTPEYPEHDRDPLDSPIFLDEDTNVVINKRYIFNSINLTQIKHDFGENKVIYGADFIHKRVSTLDEVYSIEDYSQLLSIPFTGVDGVVFDNDGDLYILKNSNSVLYIIKENEIN